LLLSATDAVIAGPAATTCGRPRRRASSLLDRHVVGLLEPTSKRVV